MKNFLFQPWARVMLALLLVVTTLSVSFSSVHAAGTDDDGVIEAGQTIYDDVFLEGDNVRVDGNVEGNVFAVGNIVTINGKISGDAFLFGNEIIIGEEAVIEGNLFTGAQNITVAGKINGSLAGGSAVLTLKEGAALARNLYYGGFSLTTEENTSIGVDIFLGGYQMLLNGFVGRDVNAGLAAAEINGTVNGNVTLEIGDISEEPVYFPTPPGVTETLTQGLRVGESAKIGGDLKYTISVDQSSKIQAEPDGQIIFNTPVPYETTQQYQQPEREFDHMRWTLGRFFTGILKNFWLNLTSLLAVGALLIVLLPGLFHRTVTELRKQPLPSAGFGILTVILGYIGLFLAGGAILAVSILFTVLSAGGLRIATFSFGFASLALIGTVFTMLVIYGSKIVVSYLVGNWILVKLFPESKAAASTFWGMALGVLIYSILRVIPFFGGVLAFIVIILGMGAMWLAYRNRKGVPETAVEVSTTPEPAQ